MNNELMDDPPIYSFIIAV